MSTQNNGLTCENAHRARHHCAQNADYLAHNTPVSALFAKVVCTLAATPLTLTHQTGELHYMRLRHADDTQPEGFM